MIRTASMGALVASLVMSLVAQAPTDFSGKWTADPEALPPPPAAGAPPPRGDMGTGWGSTITITQDAKQLVVQYDVFSRYDLQPPLKLIYALDGSQTTNTVMLSHASQIQKSRAAWDGKALVITTIHTASDPGSGTPFTTEVRHRLSLDAPTALIVEVTREGVLGGKPSTTRKVYKKS